MADYLKEYSSALDSYSSIKQMIMKNHIQLILKPSNTS
jgi:hypothetical protein